MTQAESTSEVSITAGNSSVALSSESASSVVSSAAASPDTKTPYLPASKVPTVEAPNGVRFDFNDGARVLVPALAEGQGQWRVRLMDAETGNILFDTKVSGGLVSSAKKYFVPFGVDVWFHAPDGAVTHVVQHVMYLRGRKVFVQIPVGTLGDTLAWLPAVSRFARETGALVTATVSEAIFPLVDGADPAMKLVVQGEAQKDKAFTEQFYATYALGLFFTDKEHVRQPTDFRHVGLHRTASYILGIDPWDDTPPALNVDDGERPIEEPYVCIAVQASTQCKYWNNPGGWRDVVTFLKSCGYRVVCIDLKPIYGQGIVWNHIPYGAEDETGVRPLSERARWLRHAAFFVGLSSGLAWLAHAARTPVVMISGFTHPDNEFATPYRVINWHSCNSCWNDAAHQFDHKDFLWCPRHASTPRQFECTRLITSQQVIRTVQKLLGDYALPGADRPAYVPT
ncbi:autotransporter strand-loop-strand O-heptosyltransferase [Gluconobacter kanchanaburiensis]|uniref:Autotransporter strand-loop-strand O-heptosyltransferase n=1 Tax=Gluconobacter kanchanaburiensis NBRC 103587 TaxID=1307948 RepID=A0A511BF37_9PROT|nr:autotransporter strand-loop-strand O-heptosyltransferase [Gluconobacter kanchanaburiensis]MBF0862496.1 autotransporter strand-loop-strand O-heptosyltransferase [Gluconobacter kanchanaburiensis]GBR68526.1 glycosyltransferase [Gluconobacter kanchanaburiensis NBRC 103587]GEK96377.1 autotransporter strand-loop-strand O-heptosyltransferase [Gluconobacter kanchanaburiensis NBRC 103587]